MSGAVSDKKRLFRVNAANLRNKHLYVSGHYDFFPADCVGASSKSSSGSGVADLNANLYPRPLKTEVVGEPLKPGRFSVGDGAVSLGVEVSARF